MFFKMLADDPEVATVGAEHEVRCIPEQSDHANRHIEQEVHPQSSQFRLGQAQIARFP
jgi:hypothetical protein